MKKADIDSKAEYNRIYAKIDLDAMEYNIDVLKQHINQMSPNRQAEIKIMAVIKADGYGHGAIPLALEYEKLGIDYLAVAIYQEGIALRKEGIKIPILVLGNTPEQAYEKLLDYQLTQTIYSIEMADQISRFAAKKRAKIKGHIKIDTGMGRIGLRSVHTDAHQVVAQIERICGLAGLEVEGLFTHFAKADEPEQEYTRQQMERFDQIIMRLKERQIVIPYIHASNSAGAIDYDNSNYNMVRLGIALYGLYKPEQLGLKPVLSLITNIIFVKTVEAGESISYGGDYVSESKRVIATIPVGYADGYSRALSNKGEVIVNGQKAKIVGRVCMDQCMIDVTEIDDVKQGMPVYLIGEQGDNRITVDQLADIMGTINYEVICLIGKRVPRIYMKDKEVVDSIDYFWD